MTYDDYENYVSCLTNTDICAAIARSDLESDFVHNILYEKQEDERLGVPLVSLHQARKFIDSVTLSLVKLDPTKCVLHYVTVGEWPKTLFLFDNINISYLDILERQVFIFLDTFFRRFIVNWQARLSVIDNAQTAPGLYKRLCQFLSRNAVRAVSDHLMIMEEQFQGGYYFERRKGVVDSVNELHRNIEFLSAQSLLHGKDDAPPYYHYNSPMDILRQSTETDDIPCLQNLSLDDEFYYAATHFEHNSGTDITNLEYLCSKEPLKAPEEDILFKFIDQTTDKRELSLHDRQGLKKAALCSAIEKCDLYKTIDVLQRQISLLETGIITSITGSKAMVEGLSKTTKKRESVLKRAKEVVSDTTLDPEKDMIQVTFHGSKMDQPLCTYDQCGPLTTKTINAYMCFEDDEEYKSILKKSIKHWSEAKLRPHEKNMHPKGRHLAHLFESGVITPVTKPPRDKRILDSRFEKISDWSTGRGKEDPVFKLVVNGQQQRKGIDYHHSQVPTCGHSYLRLFFAIGQGLGHEFSLFDFPEAYEHADLNEEIYVKLPQGSQYDIVKLNKCLPGLKQANACWRKIIHDILVKATFRGIPGASAFYFTRNDESNKLTMAIVHYNQILFSTGDPDFLDLFRGKLIVSGISVKDLGFPKYFLEVGIHRNEDKIIFTPESHLKDINSLVSRNSHYSPKLSEYAINGLREEYFRSLVKKLMFVSRAFRPDIAAEASILDEEGRFDNKDDERNLKKAESLVEYLNSTRSYGLVYKKPDNEPISPTAHVGVDFLRADGIGRTGYIFQIFDNPILWLSLNQSERAHGLVEGEFEACISFMRHIYPVKNMLKTLKLLNKPIQIALTNKKTVAYLAKEWEYVPDSISTKKKYLNALQLMKEQDFEVTFSHPYYIMASAFTQRVTDNPELEKIRKNLHVEEIKNNPLK